MFSTIVKLLKRKKKANKITKKRRKSPDNTKFTKVHYDYLMNLYETNLESCPQARVTLNELTRIANFDLGLDKTRTTYSKVWQGKVNRDDLPEG